MAEPDTHNNNHAQRDLVESIERRRQRRALWEREGERSLASNLAMIGALGWTIVMPTLLGVLAGRWLDGRLHSGIFWTASLIFAGLVVGCWLAWRRVVKE